MENVSDPLEKVVLALYCRSVCKEFRMPVLVSYPTLKSVYLSQIKEPMDLGTLLLLIRQKRLTVEALRTNLMLVFNNAIDFNKDSLEIIGISRHAESFASGLFEEIIKQPYRLPSTSTFSTTLFLSRIRRYQFCLEIPLRDSELRFFVDGLKSCVQSCPQLLTVVNHCIDYSIEAFRLHEKDPSNANGYISLKDLLRPLLNSCKEPAEVPILWNPEFLLKNRYPSICSLLNGNNPPPPNQQQQQQQTVMYLPKLSVLPFLSELDDLIGVLLIHITERATRGCPLSSVWGRPVACIWAAPPKQSWWPAIVLAGGAGTFISPFISKINLARLPAPIHRQLCRLRPRPSIHLPQPINNSSSGGNASSSVVKEYPPGPLVDINSLPDGYLLVEFLGSQDFGWVKAKSVTLMTVDGVPPADPTTSVASTPATPSSAGATVDPSITQLSDGSIPPPLSISPTAASASASASPKVCTSESIRLGVAALRWLHEERFTVRDEPKPMDMSSSEDSSTFAYLLSAANILPPTTAQLIETCVTPFNAIAASGSSGAERDSLDMDLGNSTVNASSASVTSAQPGPKSSSKKQKEPSKKSSKVASEKNESNRPFDPKYSHLLVNGLFSVSKFPESWNQNSNATNDLAESQDESQCDGQTIETKEQSLEAKILTTPNVDSSLEYLAAAAVAVSQQSMESISNKPSVIPEVEMDVLECLMRKPMTPLSTNKLKKDLSEKYTHFYCQYLQYLKPVVVPPSAPSAKSAKSTKNSSSHQHKGSSPSPSLTGSSPDNSSKQKHTTLIKEEVTSSSSTQSRLTDMDPPQSVSGDTNSKLKRKRVPSSRYADDVSDNLDNGGGDSVNNMSDMDREHEGHSNEFYSDKETDADEEYHRPHKQHAGNSAREKEHTGPNISHYTILYGGVTHYHSGEGAIISRTVDFNAPLFQRESSDQRERIAALKQELHKLKSAITILAVADQWRQKMEPVWTTTSNNRDNQVPSVKEEEA